LTIQVQSDDNNAFSSPKVCADQVVLLADLKAGFISQIDKIPRSITEQFVRINYVVTGAAATTGKITSGIVGAVDGAYVGNNP
jgi:hypothetical protein